MHADHDGNYTITRSGYGNIRILFSRIEPEPEDLVNGLLRDMVAWIDGFDPFT